MALNPDQARHVGSVIAHVDHLLQQVIDAIASDHSPLDRHRADINPDERRLTRAAVARLRMRMASALDRFGIPRPPQDLSARHQVDVSLQFANIAVSDLTERALRGYGPLDPADALELETLAADLRKLADQAQALLREDEPGQMTALLREVDGPVGDILRALDQFSTTHGIALVRPLIKAAAERWLSNSLYVGVFGRVSAGKSSLINALVGFPLLPVGSTPVTAVPVIISHGESGLVVHFLIEPSQIHPLADIAQFASEQHNPDNRLGVRSIDAATPTVPAGLTFVDTPGVGSIAASGPAQAFAWLPRCDLGMVLISAGTPVSHEDIALVDSLSAAGIPCQVVLSKSDTLSVEDRDEAVSYVTRELAGEHPLVEQLPVRALSLQDLGLDGPAALLAGLLLPRARDRQVMRRVQTVARLRQLVALTDAALAGDAGEDLPLPTAIHASRETAREVVRTQAELFRDSGDSLMAATVAAIVTAWANRSSANEAAQLTIRNAGSTAIHAIREAVQAASPGDVLDGLRLPPLFDPASLADLSALDRPAFLLRWAWRHLARRRLDPIQPALKDAATRYASRLHAWGMSLIDRAAELPQMTMVDQGGARDPALRQLSEMIDGWGRENSQD